MRTARWLLITAGLICQIHPADANPVPSSLIGTWTDLPQCSQTGHRMIFSANSITIVQDNGARTSVDVATSGTIDDRLEIRIVKPPVGLPSEANGPKVGDRLVMRRDGVDLRVIAHGSATELQNIENAPALHRCAP